MQEKKMNDHKGEFVTSFLHQEDERDFLEGTTSSISTISYPREVPLTREQRRKQARMMAKAEAKQKKKQKEIAKRLGFMK
jgi:hypothetical protein